MLIRIPAPCSTLVNAWLVNWLPWSLLKISGVPSASARFRASTQNELSSVIDISQLSTYRLKGVHHRRHVHPAPPQGDVRDVRRPDLIRTVDALVFEQIRIDRIALVFQAGSRPGPDRLQAHHTHQPANALVVDRVSIPPQHRRHPADAEVRMRRVLHINQTHQLLIVAILALGAVIQTAAGQSQQIALAKHAQSRMSHVDQHALAMSIQFDQSFFWSQSSSTFIWPICW